MRSKHFLWVIYFKLNNTFHNIFHKNIIYGFTLWQLREREREREKREWDHLSFIIVLNFDNCKFYSPPKVFCVILPVQISSGLNQILQGFVHVGSWNGTFNDNNNLKWKRTKNNESNTIWALKETNKDKKKHPTIIDHFITQLMWSTTKLYFRRCYMYIIIIDGHREGEGEGGSIKKSNLLLLCKIILPDCFLCFAPETCDGQLGLQSYTSSFP
jgi:hypothetical protein